MSVFIWEVLNDCAHPWGKIPNEKVIVNIIQGKLLEINKNWDDEIQELLKMCWKQNPDDRPNMKTIAETFQTLRNEIDTEKYQASL